MQYEEMLKYLYSLGNEVLAMKLGLDRVERLLNELGSPHTTVPSVLVAGTNGKGSTCAMLSRILRQAGLKVGLFTSPHLMCIEERIQVNGELISPGTFSTIMAKIRTTVENLMATGELPARPTFFEHITVAAFLYFQRYKADLLVLEVGLGGRLDATNVVTPRLAIITNIGYDHQEYLGQTLAEIAVEKAGIIKPGTATLVADTQPPEAKKAIQTYADSVGAGVTWVAPLPIRGTSPDAKLLVKLGGQEVILPWRGAYQAQNAALAVAAANQLLSDGPQREAQVVSGLQQADWPGRAEWIPGSPPLLLDGAHNPAGAQALAHCLRFDIHHRPITLIFSTVRDKPAREMMEPFVPFVSHLIITPITGSPRAQAPSELAVAAAQLWIFEKIMVERDVATAIAKARAITPAEGLIVVAGSLYLVAEARHCLKVGATP